MKERPYIPNLKMTAVQFERAYTEDKLYRVMAGGVTDLWDAAKRNPRRVFAHIEVREMSGLNDGNEYQYLADVITNAYGAGRYDCWWTGRYDTYEEAYHALLWLCRDDWAVLRNAPKRPNSGADLPPNVIEEMTKYVNKMTGPEYSLRKNGATYFLVNALGEDVDEFIPPDDETNPFDWVNENYPETRVNPEIKIEPNTLSQTINDQRLARVSEDWWYIEHRGTILLGKNGQVMQFPNEDEALAEVNDLVSKYGSVFTAHYKPTWVEAELGPDFNAGGDAAMANATANKWPELADAETFLRSMRIERLADDDLPPDYTAARFIDGPPDFFPFVLLEEETSGAIAGMIFRDFLSGPGYLPHLPNARVIFGPTGNGGEVLVWVPMDIINEKARFATDKTITEIDMLEAADAQLLSYAR